MQYWIHEKKLTRSFHSLCDANCHRLVWQLFIQFNNIVEMPNTSTNVQPSKNIAKVSQKSLNGLSKVSQKSPKSLSKVSQKSFKSVSKVSFKSLSKVSQKSLKSLSKVLQKSLKSLSKVSQKSFKSLSRVSQKPLWRGWNQKMSKLISDKVTYWAVLDS